jgi:hypothetical protein
MSQARSLSISSALIIALGGCSVAFPFDQELHSTDATPDGDVDGDADGDGDADTDEDADPCDLYNLNISPSTGLTALPRVVWTGEEYGVVWIDNGGAEYDAALRGEVYFTRLSSAGDVIGTDPLAITGTDNQVIAATLEWTGDGYGLVYSRNRLTGRLTVGADLYFMRLDAVGRPTAAGTLIASAERYAASPNIVWGFTEDGGSFGVVWADMNVTITSSTVHFTRLEANGRPVGGSIELSASEDSYWPSIAWNADDEEFGIVWVDEIDRGSRISFRRVPATAPAPAIVQVTDPDRDGDSGYAFLAWGEGHYGLVYVVTTIDLTNDVQFSALGADGSPAGTSIQLESDVGRVTWPAVVWAGGRFGVAWRSGGDSASINVATVTADPTTVGATQDVTLVQSNVDFPSLAWADGTFGVAWQDLRGVVPDHTMDIVFASGVCPP